ncbi:hypothetical protein BC793_13257 [Actinoplanes xinjiangensis]|uniref:Uncharacterized protein n=1 Tax=Actinoplanes xinjiangensis TaxID=512350 RepID=A0A316EJ66_9ACTN|nr:hypothetical protein BC793_13257 [Actinoplanes xinjiangensis]GIF43918.1 hypothetical protein Axi01nite_82290 [Actinoplanes xinjiangensis]
MEHPSKVIVEWLVSNCPSEAAELHTPAAEEAIIVSAATGPSTDSGRHPMFSM